MTDAEILAVLLGRKLLRDGVWLSYAADGSQNPDPDDVLRRGVHGALLYNANPRKGGDGSSRSYYLKRKDRLLVFDSLEQAQDYLDAEKAAEEAIAKAQKTSRRARKRARERFLAQAAPTPQESLEMALVERVQALFDLPALPDLEGYASAVYMMRLHELAGQLQEDEALTLLLFAA